MPFIPYDKHAKAGHRRMTGAVRILRIKGAHGRLSIAADLFDAIGKPERMGFMVGTGEDAGRVKLVPAAEGYVTLKRTRDSAATAVTLPAGIGAHAPRRSTAVAHQLTDDGLIVDLRPFMARPPIAAAARTVEPTRLHVVGGR